MQNSENDFQSNPPEAKQTSPGPWPFGWLLDLHEVGVVLSIGGLVFGWLGRFHFLPDLASHFRLQAICVLLFCGIVLLVFRRRRWGAIGLGAALIALSTLLPFVIKPESAAATTTPFRFLSMNVLTRNDRKSDVVTYLKESSPDVFVLLEVDEAWSKAVQDTCSSEWPYQVHEPRSDNFGILLCSKRKPIQTKVLYLGSDLPSVEATVVMPNGESVRLVGTHPLPPMNNHNWRSRNDQLAAIAETIGQHPLRKKSLVAGDLNCSPWSPFFKDLLKRSGLRDSANGFGLPPTWYVADFFLTALPIDHILVGSDISVVNRTVGPDLGSDHRAVIADCVIAADN